MNKYIRSILSAVSALALSGVLFGCAREISHTETNKIRNDGTVDTKEKTVTQNPDGTVTKKEDSKTTRP